MELRATWCWAVRSVKPKCSEKSADASNVVLRCVWSVWWDFSPKYIIRVFLIFRYIFPLRVKSNRLLQNLDFFLPERGSNLGVRVFLEDIFVGHTGPLVGHTAF